MVLHGVAVGHHVRVLLASHLGPTFWVADLLTLHLLNPKSMLAAVQDVGEWLVDLFSDTANDAYPGLSDQQKEHLQHLLPWTRAVTEVSLRLFLSWLCLSS